MTPSGRWQDEPTHAPLVLPADWWLAASVNNTWRSDASSPELLGPLSAYRYPECLPLMLIPTRNRSPPLFSGCFKRHWQLLCLKCDAAVVSGISVHGRSVLARAYIISATRFSYVTSVCVRFTT